MVVPPDVEDEVVDPVCGEVFPPSLAVFKSTHEDHTVFFCSSTCKATFDAAPDRFSDAAEVDA